MSSQTKKNKFTKIIVGIALATATAGFIFSDAAQYMRSNTQETIRTVGSLPIRTSDVMRERDGLLENLGKIPTDQALRLEVLNKAIENLTMRYAISEYARSLGLIVSDTQLNEVIQSIGAFKTLNGEFDQLKFKTVLRNQGIPIQVFKNNIADGILRETYLSPLETEFSLSKNSLNLVTKLAQTIIDVDVYSINYDKLPKSWHKIIPPTEKQLSEIYNQQKQSLIRPELKDISYIIFDSKTLSDKITVSSQEIKDFYEKNKSKIFFRPEERKVSQIIAKSLEEAQKIYKKLEDGSSFIASAQDAGFPSEDIDLGYILPDALNNSAVAKTVFSMEVGEISKPLKTDFGHAIYFVEAIQPENIQTFEESKKEIQEKIYTQKVSKYLADITSQIDDDLAGGANLEEISKKYGSEVTQLKKVQPNGQIYQSEINQLINPLIPLEYLSSYSEQHDIPLIQDKSGAIIAMKVLRTEPERVITFQEAHQQLLKEDINSQKQNILTVVAEKIKQSPQKTVFAKANNIAVTHHNFKRTGMLPAEIASNDFQNLVYASQKGQDFIGNKSDTHKILTLVTNITMPEKTLKTDQQDITNKIQNSFKMTLQEDIFKFIEKKVPIKTDDEALKNLFNKENSSY